MTVVPQSVVACPVLATDAASIVTPMREAARRGRPVFLTAEQSGAVAEYVGGLVADAIAYQHEDA